MARKNAKRNELQDESPVTSTLKPCPFCGGVSIDPRGWACNDGRHGPACDTCGGSADSSEKWNRRPLEAQKDAEIRAQVESKHGIEADLTLRAKSVEEESERIRHAAMSVWSAHESGADGDEMLVAWEELEQALRAGPNTFPSWIAGLESAIFEQANELQVARAERDNLLVEAERWRWAVRELACQPQPRHIPDLWRLISWSGHGDSLEAAVDAAREKSQMELPAK